MNSEEFKEISARLDRIEQLSLMNVKPIIRSEEAAAFAGTSIEHLHHLTSTRQIPYYKMGNKLYFKKSELEQWMTKRRVMTEEEIDSAATTYVVTERWNAKPEANRGQI